MSRLKDLAHDIAHLGHHDLDGREAHALRAVQSDARSFVGMRIGEIVVAYGFATDEQVGMAVERAQQEGRLTGAVLCDLGILTKDQLTQSIAARTQMAYVDLRTVELEERALRMLDATTAARYRAVPVQFVDNDTLLVAISEPSNVLAVDDISLITGQKVRPALTTNEQLEELLARLSRTDIVAATRAAEAASATVFDESGDTTDDEAAAAKLLDSVLTNALRQRASDVHLDPYSSGATRVRYRIDGLTHDSTIVAAQLAPRLFARLKLLAGMDISIKHLPQDGRATYDGTGVEVTLRVATLPTIYGESAAIRILDRNNVPALDKLGMDDISLSVLQNALRRPHGAILATGPTGSGKTTTLYAALAELNVPERTILTIEDPVEYPLHGVKQVQVNPKRGLTFATGLRTMLRSDPDVVMVGEIRDHETAQIGVEAALTGHLVLATLHTNDAASATTRLAELGVERYLVASSVECVVASRLARKICHECRVETVIDEPLLRESGFEIEADFEPIAAFEAVGCGRCNGTGHRGRVGIYEVLVVDDEIRRLLVERYPSNAIEEVARLNGMVTLREAALTRVKQGTISLAEASRITAAV